MNKHILAIVFWLAFLLPEAAIAQASTHLHPVVTPNYNQTAIWGIETTPTPHPTPTPLPTQVAIIPLVEQGQGDFRSTSTPPGGQALTPEATGLFTPTVTPTFIPPQDTSTNIPIVFGAMMIVVVIVVAWFFVSRSEIRSK